MRILRALACILSLGSLVAASLDALAGCSTSDSKDPAVADAAIDAAEQVPPVEPAEAGAPPCKLSSNMTTGVAACDECLQKACCLTIVACLGEATCGALNDCLNDCRATLGTGDAGVQCARTCAQDKDEPAKRLTDLLECESTRCGTPCK